MICPLDKSQMVNFTKELTLSVVEAQIKDDNARQYEIIPLPSGGIATDDVYETWYVYECPTCGRRVKEAYRCEVILDKQ